MIELAIYISLILLIPASIAFLLVALLQWYILMMESTWTDCAAEDTPKYQETE